MSGLVEMIAGILLSAPFEGETGEALQVRRMVCWRYAQQIADAIAPELAAAETRAAERMREAAAQWHEAEADEHDVSFRQYADDGNALASNQHRASATAIRALPVPASDPADSTSARGCGG